MPHSIAEFRPIFLCHGRRLAAFKTLDDFGLERCLHAVGAHQLTDILAGISVAALRNLVENELLQPALVTIKK